MSDINDPNNIGPVVGAHLLVGPDIEAPGWNQTYASPYVMSATPPDAYNGPWRANFVRGRHPFRTQPRTLGPDSLVPDALLPSIAANLSPTMVRSAPAYAHGVGGCAACGGLGDANLADDAMMVVKVALLAGGAYLLYRWWKRG